MVKKPDERQAERFKEAGRPIGFGDDEVAFDEKPKVVARHRPKPTSQSPGQ
jgi:hypothetical protein